MSCIVEVEESCINKAWLDDWKKMSICRDGSVAAARQAAETPILVQDTAAHIADLPVKGSTVAMASDEDPRYDFFPSTGYIRRDEELDNNYTDDSILRFQRSERLKRQLFPQGKHAWHDPHVIVINCFICMTASLYSIAKACI